MVERALLVLSPILRVIEESLQQSWLGFQARWIFTSAILKPVDSTPQVEAHCFKFVNFPGAQCLHKFLHKVLQLVASMSWPVSIWIKHIVAELETPECSTAAVELCRRWRSSRSELTWPDDTSLGEDSNQSFNVFRNLPDVTNGGDRVGEPLQVMGFSSAFNIRGTKIFADKVSYFIAFSREFFLCHGIVSQCHNSSDEPCELVFSLWPDGGGEDVSLIGLNEVEPSVVPCEEREEAVQ